MATSYDMISRHDVNIDNLTETREFKEEDELTVTVGLKNIRDASYEEQQESRFDIRTVVLEVITKKSIEEWLNTSMFGLVDAKRVRHSDVRNCSLVRAWARSVRSLNSFFSEHWFRARIIDTGYVNDVKMVR